MTKEHIEELLKGIKYPGYSRDIVSFRLVKKVACNHGAVSVAIELTGGNDEIAATIKHEVETLLRQTDGVDHVHVQAETSCRIRSPSRLDKRAEKPL